MQLGIWLKYINENFNIQDEDTPVTKEWEAFRGKIIDHAFEKILYPELRKEVRSKLLEKGKVLIKQRCSDKIYTYLKASCSDLIS